MGTLYNESLNTTHYILLETPSDEIRKAFANEFNIKVIGYTAVKGNHSTAIRELLSEIAAPLDSKVNKLSIVSPNTLRMPDTIPTAKQKRRMETSLFCKKMRIETIDDYTVEYSKDCFFMSDKLIRYLKKYKYSKTDIKKILVLPYLIHSQNCM